MSAAAAELAAGTASTRLSPRLVTVIAEELGELPGAEPWRGEVLRRAEEFRHGLRVGDDDAALAAAVRLIGLGEGSTPAGDDYLVGALHALALSGVEQAEDSLLATIAKAGHGRTTTASAAWLAAAARGEASAVWRALLDAIAAGDEAAVRTAARAVCATGHTSGAFSLRGFLDTLG